MNPATGDNNGCHHHVECQTTSNHNGYIASAQSTEHFDSAGNTEWSVRVLDINVGNGCDQQMREGSMTAEDAGNYNRASSPLEESGEPDSGAIETPQMLRWAYAVSKGRMTLAETLENARWEEGTTQNEV